MPVDGDVYLVVPAEARFARVARTLAATCAALHGFDVDRMDDVRLLVDEVFAAMLAAGARRVHLAFVLRNGALVMELVADHGRDVDRQPADAQFVHTLAGALATDVSIELDRDPPRFAATMAAG